MQSASDPNRELDVDLDLFERILLATDGTVTDLVALYAGEPIRVKKLGQSIRSGDAPAELGCDAPAQLLERRILLSGAQRDYLYAESLFVVERLSPATRAGLLESDRPIGLLWKEEKLETFREVVRQSVAPGAAIAAHFGRAADAPFVWRSYLIHHHGLPLGRITEAWPQGSFA